MPEQVETVEVAADPVPVSAYTVAVVGAPSLLTLRHHSEGDTMKVRIVRACNVWLEGDEPEVNAEYGRQLVANLLATEVGDANAVGFLNSSKSATEQDREEAVPLPSRAGKKPAHNAAATGPYLDRSRPGEGCKPKRGERSSG